MFPDKVFEERRELCEKISALPPDYMKDNAGMLLKIINEFEQSLALELQIIQRIKRLDVEDPSGVNDFAMNFADYVEQRSFNMERTSCGNIARIYRTKITPLQTQNQSDRNRVGELEILLESFFNADKQFTEQIEPTMDMALAIVREINCQVIAGQIAEARQRQADFAIKYEAEVKRLKYTIKEMNELGNKLIDQL